MPNNAAPEEKAPTPPAWGGMEIGLHLFTSCLVGTVLGWAFAHYVLGVPDATLGGLLGGLLGFIAWLYMLWKIVKAA